MTSAAFLSGYWQKRPLFMPAGLIMEPTLDPDELAWLATQEDVESRIVFTRVDGESLRYEVQDGPFSEKDLAALPAERWTLLVQDVEKHLPDFRAQLAAVDFIPDWRIDDLMVSYAAPGGSVGPHVDHYDVFLCQGRGEREWRLGDPGSCRADDSSPELSLVVPFNDERPQIVTESDVLYLPPGVPHWGIARSACMTWSIGFRAPNLAELKAGIDRVLRSSEPDATQAFLQDTTAFYTDPDLHIDESACGLISAAAVRRVRDLSPEFDALDDNTVATILGCVATDPKPWLDPEIMSESAAHEFIESVSGDAMLAVHGMARIAYSETESARQAFANGHAMDVSSSGLECWREICRQRRIFPGRMRAAGERALLRWLLTHGVADLTEFGA